MSQTAILVKEKGVVRIDKPFDFMCSQLRNGRYKVTIERYTEPRTISQNALMWLWFTCIEQETGTGSSRCSGRRNTGSSDGSSCQSGH